MKTTLLIDINDTLDDGSDFEYREKQHFLDLKNGTPPTGVMGPRKGIEDFSDFLIEYREKLLPIFWTSVGLYGQKHVRYDWLKTDVIGFDGEVFHEFNKDNNFSASSIGIGTPKSIDFDILMRFIKGKSKHIIWFEDGLNFEDQCFVYAHENLNHVGVNQIDTLTEKIPEIIKLIK